MNLTFKLEVNRTTHKPFAPNDSFAAIRFFGVGFSDILEYKHLICFCLSDISWDSPPLSFLLRVIRVFFRPFSIVEHRDIFVLQFVTIWHAPNNVLKLRTIHRTSSKWKPPVEFHVRAHFSKNNFGWNLGELSATVLVFCKKTKNKTNKVIPINSTTKSAGKSTRLFRILNREFKI